MRNPLKINDLNNGFEKVRPYLDTPGLEIEELINGCLFRTIDDFEETHSDDVA